MHVTAMDVLAKISSNLAELAELVGKLRQPTEFEFVSQHDSPLTKRLHLSLVRQGKLKGYKVGKLVFVRRADLVSYIEANSVALSEREPPSELEDWEQAAVMAGIRRRRRAAKRALTKP